MFSQTLRVVCEQCNNTWMSQMQDQAKPLLLQLINGNWPALDRFEQSALSNWAIMQTCVYEYCDPLTATIPQSHRDYFYAHKAAPPDWLIWIGLCGSEQSPLETHANHHGAKFTMGGLPFANLHCFQSTGFTFGNLLIQTFTDTPPGVFYGDRLDFEQRFGVFQIHPFKAERDGKPLVRHDKDGFYRISNTLAFQLGLPCYQLP